MWALFHSMVRHCAVVAVLSLVQVFPASAMEPGLAAELEDQIRRPFHGDFNNIVERGTLRVLVPFSKTSFFIDKGVQRGTTVDLMTELGKFLLNEHGDKVRHGDIILLPTPRDRLFDDLVNGRGDLAMGNLTITPERLEKVNFSTPLIQNAREVPLTPDNVPDLSAPDDLSGMEIHARPSSSYFQSLETLNEHLTAAGKDSVKLVEADENLEDEDLLDLVKAGGIPAIVIDEHKADFWMQVLDGLKIHPEAAVRTGADIAIAVRKDAPELLKEINKFAETVKKGTLLGNIILKRYLKDAKYLKKMEGNAHDEQLNKLAKLFQKYGDEYSIDWLLVAAQSFQESKFDQTVKSKAGAVGLMQIKPSTAEGNPISIKGVAQDPDKNVHAGVKYLRHVADTYFEDLKDDKANQTFFALAAYNAGPSRFDKLRKLAETRGYDPNKWFGNVEWIVAERISYEPFHYVSNIYKYYVVFHSGDERYQARRGTSRAD